MTAGPVFTIDGGRLDATSGGGLERRVADALALEVDEVVVACHGLALVDSSGLGALVRCLKRCRAAGVALVLVDATPPLVRLLEMTRLASAFDMQKSRPKQTSNATNDP